LADADGRTVRHAYEEYLQYSAQEPVASDDTELYGVLPKMGV